MADDFQDIGAAELRTYMAGRREKDYLLVDVRQPDEYSAGHIPGAVLIPLGELSARLGELPLNRDIVFYCRSGKRSRGAALFAGALSALAGRIYNLAGGILAWDGHSLPSVPNMAVFDLGGSDRQLLLQSMNLERGAERFYTALRQRFTRPPWDDTLAVLAGAEEQHARMIYRAWAGDQVDPPDFATVYSALDGRIVEGGRDTETLLAELDQVTDAPCRTVVELALGIEHAAYDLSRAMAHHFRDRAIAATFQAIAEAEKEHMRLVARVLSHCGP